MLLAGQQLPQHIAFIPDGNRRFAAQLGLKAIIGHYLGNKKVRARGARRNQPSERLDGLYCVENIRC